MTEPCSLYPHEVVPEPLEGAPLLDWTRYYLARAQGYWLRYMARDEGDDEAITLAIQAADYALTLAALLDGLSGEDAFRYAADRVPEGGAGEWIRHWCRKLGVDVEVIRAYRHEDFVRRSTAITAVAAEAWTDRKTSMTHDWYPAEHGLWQCGTCLMAVRQSTDESDGPPVEGCPGSPYSQTGEQRG